MLFTDPRSSATPMILTDPHYPQELLWSHWLPWSSLALWSSMCPMVLFTPMILTDSIISLPFIWVPWSSLALMTLTGPSDPHRLPLSHWSPSYSSFSYPTPDLNSTWPFKMLLLLGTWHLCKYFCPQIPYWNQEFHLGFKKTPLKIKLQNVTHD